jgi:hypothetical protein
MIKFGVGGGSSGWLVFCIYEDPFRFQKISFRYACPQWPINGKGLLFLPHDSLSIQNLIPVGIHDYLSANFTVSNAVKQNCAISPKVRLFSTIKSGIYVPVSSQCNR